MDKLRGQHPIVGEVLEYRQYAKLKSTYVDGLLKVMEIWQNISDENISANADLDGYRSDFSKLFGFESDGVDYEADCDTAVGIESIG